MKWIHCFLYFSSTNWMMWGGVASLLRLMAITLPVRFLLKFLMVTNITTMWANPAQWLTGDPTVMTGGVACRGQRSDFSDVNIKNQLAMPKVMNFSCQSGLYDAELMFYSLIDAINDKYHVIDCCKCCTCEAYFLKLMYRSKKISRTKQTPFFP